jgi:molecular chaperone GrpE
MSKKKENEQEVDLELAQEDTLETNETHELSSQEIAENKIKELEDKHLRLFSEFENYRKRTQKEKSDLITSAKADTFKLLLPILDDFDRALKSISEASNVDSLKEGVLLIYNKITKSLETQGLTEMDVKEKEFNAEEHEAITNIPAPSEKLKGKILDVLEKGYILNEKIIRYPKVIVGN